VESLKLLEGEEFKETLLDIVGCLVVGCQQNYELSEDQGAVLRWVGEQIENTQYLFERAEENFEAAQEDLGHLRFGTWLVLVRLAERLGFTIPTKKKDVRCDFGVILGYNEEAVKTIEEKGSPI
jgi:hypothetical protein